MKTNIVLSFVVLSILVVSAVPVVALAAGNFNPSNNVVANGDFSIPSLTLLNGTGNQPPSKQSVGGWAGYPLPPAGNQPPLFTNIDGKSALVFSNNTMNGDSIIYQTLNQVRVNATTRVHFEFYIKPDTSIQSYSQTSLTVIFGAFGKTTDRTLTQTCTYPDCIGNLEILITGGGSSVSSGRIGGAPPYFAPGWNVVDLNLQQTIYNLIGENVTGYYFDCPIYQDVSFLPVAQYTSTLAVTDFAVYDAPGANQIISTTVPTNIFNISGSNFPIMAILTAPLYTVNFTETGLPTGLGSVSVNGTSYSLPYSVSVFSGTSLTYSYTPAIMQNKTVYYLASDPGTYLQVSANQTITANYSSIPPQVVTNTVIQNATTTHVVNHYITTTYTSTNWIPYIPLWLFLALIVTTDIAGVYTYSYYSRVYRERKRRKEATEQAHKELETARSELP